MAPYSHVNLTELDDQATNLGIDPSQSTFALEVCRWVRALRREPSPLRSGRQGARAPAQAAVGDLRARERFCAGTTD